MIMYFVICIIVLTAPKLLVDRKHTPSSRLTMSSFHVVRISNVLTLHDVVEQNNDSQTTEPSLCQQKTAFHKYLRLDQQRVKKVSSGLMLVEKKLHDLKKTTNMSTIDKDHLGSHHDVKPATGKVTCAGNRKRPLPFMQHVDLDLIRSRGVAYGDRKTIGDAELGDGCTIRKLTQSVDPSRTSDVMKYYKPSSAVTFSGFHDVLHSSRDSQVINRHLSEHGSICRPRALHLHRRILSNVHTECTERDDYTTSEHLHHPISSGSSNKSTQSEGKNKQRCESQLIREKSLH